MQSINQNHNLTFDYKRYLNLFKRKKWTIFLLFLVTSIVVFGISLKLSPKQIYSTNALLQLEDKGNLSASNVSNSRDEMEGKLGTLLSRSFLRRIVTKLSLNLVIYTDDRNVTVDSLRLAEKHFFGLFKIENGDNDVKLYYTDPSEEIEDQLIPSEEYYFVNNVFRYKGIELFIKDTFWDEHNDLLFAVQDIDAAVKNLRGSLEADFQRRSRSLLEITHKGTDRHLITETLAVLIHEFVSQNLDIKRFHTREVLSILSDQLTAAKRDLDIAVDELKIFRQANPLIGAPRTTNVIDELGSYKEGRTDIEKKKSELENLILRHANAEGDERLSILNEILSFLSAQGLPTVSVLTTEFLNLRSERVRLLDTHAETHPNVLANSDKLANNEEKVLTIANQQLIDWDNQLSTYQSQIRNQNYKIRNLPAKELHYAELQRKRNVADDIYSSLLIKYNQAKVADAVEVGDIIIIDMPILPKSVSRANLLLKFGATSLILGLLIGFGVVVVFDLFDKTVRTSEQLERATTLKVLSKIPVIGSEKDSFQDGMELNKKKIDPKLVTSDYSPTPMGEAYRSLRTHLLFKDSNYRLNSIFITSLNASEGKSLNASNLAITFAQQKIPTILIDADLRRGVLHNSFACEKKPGLSDFLYSKDNLNDKNVQKIIQQTHVPNLFLISSGMQVPNPSELLGTTRSKEFFEFIKSRFGFVILDTPPIMVTSDAIILSQCVDAGLFIVRSGKTNITNANNKINEYADFRSKIYGLILNCAEYEGDKYGYKYSYYNY